MRYAVLALIGALCAPPAFAQSAYVAASAGMDVFRSDGLVGRGLADVTADGEAVAYSLRLGTQIGSRWGVEVEFTRPSLIEHDIDQGGFPIPLAAGQLSSSTVATAAAVGILPIVQSRMHFERRNTTLDTVAWVAQGIGDRVAMVYLGGVAFTRVVETREFDFARRTALFVPDTTRSIDYGAGPVAGVEARIDLTDHVMLVPGVRLHGLGGSVVGGWLLRSSVGLGWRF